MRTAFGRQLHPTQERGKRFVAYSTSRGGDGMRFHCVERVRYAVVADAILDVAEVCFRVVFLLLRLQFL